MRDFRRLPPLLRILNIVRLVLALVGLSLLGVACATLVMSLRLQSSASSSGDNMHLLLLLGLNLGLLGTACGHVVDLYCLRFRYPDSGPYPFNSWQSQLRALALLAVLPLGALLLAIVLSPGFWAFFVIFALSLLAAVVWSVAWMWTADPSASRWLLRICWRWAQ